MGRLEAIVADQAGESMSVTLSKDEAAALVAPKALARIVLEQDSRSSNS